MKKSKTKKVNNYRRNLIEIGRVYQGIDDEGFNISEWKTRKKAWTKIRNLRGREFEIGASIQAEDKKVFNCLYSNDITEKDYIKYNGKIYNIYHIDNLYEENTEMNLFGATVNSSE